MSELLWLIPALPLAGFLKLTVIGSRLSRLGVMLTGVGSVGLSAAAALVVGIGFIASPPPGHVYTQKLWTWVQINGFSPDAAFTLDALSLVMVSVITVVGFLIHLYSAEFMAGDDGYSRFFAYMNLFVASMLTLVLADNLLLLYLGWEGVGLCSYLLIGFWYRDAANGRAAMKAFIVTRVGDAAMAVGLFLTYSDLGTLQIHDLMERALQQWAPGSAVAVAAAALLLGGAVGKSAQLPLQTWLPDAMAGPTPVSALIHAATMVTAGVYLIARTHVLFSLAPAVQSAVAIIGAVTLLLAGFSALTQRDIKRVLAYSTMSQIGYMFLALGVGAWSAAIFHFMTHAFFKALLFLGAGVVIASLDDEHDMFKMGGLRRDLPLTFRTFLIGASSLAALPLVTAGFYSKDLILWDAWSSSLGGPWLWAAGTTGALLTALYTFRMVFLTFFGHAKRKVKRRPGTLVRIPLIVLAVLSTIGGVVELPETLGDFPLLSRFLGTVLPSTVTGNAAAASQAVFQLIASGVAVFGFGLAFLLYLKSPRITDNLMKAPLGYALHCFWYSGWNFDWMYEALFVRPFVWVARINRNDVIDLFYQGVAWFSSALHRGLSLMQTGLVREYAMVIALGAVLIIGIVIFL
ncbi:MAG TPA: NADH-quinone oxidoreductase subunit L [Dissulfurispiraceae bacterium]|nr:NADH-quinone oxidoreductase subunit L [Dissulfurispiraceae bacterium]